MFAGLFNFQRNDTKVLKLHNNLMNSFDKPLISDEVKDNYGYCKVMDGLYLGDYETAKNDLILDSLGIRRIFSVGYDLACVHELKYEYFTVGIEDDKNEDIYVFFEDAYKIIKKALADNAPMFVHCMVGRSRSASIVISFCIRRYKWTFVDAYNFTMKNRSVICPNRGFEKQYIEYFLRYNTNILNIRNPKFDYKYHIHNGHKLTKTRNKKIRYIDKSKDISYYKKVRASKTRLEQRAKDEWVVKLCRCFGNFIIDNYHVERNKRKELLITSKPKNYIDEVSFIVFELNND
jgi:hypothetical protein